MSKITEQDLQPRIVKISDEPLIYRLLVDPSSGSMDSTNVYYIKGTDRDLMIDSGWTGDIAMASMQESLDALGIDMSRTDIFLTHNHPDHRGLIEELSTNATRVFTAAQSAEALEEIRTGIYMNAVRDKAMAYTIDDEVVNFLECLVEWYSISKPERFTTVDDRVPFEVGGHKFTPIYTPGHAIGHSCLLMEDYGILFSGDHLLFHITPNMTPYFTNDGDPAGDFMTSMKLLKGVDFQTVLPAHGDINTIYTREMSLERAAALTAHTERRLDLVYSIVAENPGLTAAELTPKLKWKRPFNAVQDVRVGLRYFYINMSVVLLNHLVNEGRVICKNIDGENRYFPTQRWL